MAKIQNISKIHPTLGFTEFDILERNSFGKASNGSTAIYAGIAGISGHKASAQQIQGCGGILSVLLQEKKEESFKD